MNTENKVQCEKRDNMHLHFSYPRYKLQQTTLNWTLNELLKAEKLIKILIEEKWKDKKERGRSGHNNGR